VERKLRLHSCGAPHSLSSRKPLHEVIILSSLDYRGSGTDTMPLAASSVVNHWQWAIPFP
jgi:hypothetical protein